VTPPAGLIEPGPYWYVCRVPLPRSFPAGRSFNGRTRGSGPRYRGSNPCLPAKSTSQLQAPLPMFQEGHSRQCVASPISSALFGLVKASHESHHLTPALKTLASMGEFESQTDLRRLPSSIGSPTGTPCPAGPADSGGGWTRRRYISIGQRNRAPAAYVGPEACRRRLEDRAPPWIVVGQSALTSSTAGQPSATGGRERAVAMASFDCYPRMRE
jgi:hypothetical protein